MTPEQGLDMEALEAMVDRHGVSGVLSMLSEICAEKAEHLRVNWQDRPAAGVWNRRGNAIEKVAERLTREI
jgi:hypothetical protein